MRQPFTFCLSSLYCYLGSPTVYVLRQHINRVGGRSSEAHLPADVLSSEEGEILNICNLPVLNNLMSHIRNPHDMARGRMQVWLSALAELPGLRWRMQSSEGLHGFWRETMLRAPGRTRQDSMSDFILCRHRQVIPCSQQLLNYL